MHVVTVRVMDHSNNEIMVSHVPNLLHSVQYRGRESMDDPLGIINDQQPLL